MRRIRPVAAIVILAALPAHGEDGEGMEGILSLLEEERIVSASRHEQSMRDSPASITVITREQIELSGARGFADLLRLVPGFDVIDINATYVSTSIRGFGDESNTALLVLIDGVKVNLELTGGAIFAALPLPLEEVERIEVIRGPGSAIWGQNAFLGVVNIITRDPREATEGTAMVRGGGFGGRTATVRYQRDGAWAWRAYGSADAQDGRVNAREDGRDSARAGFTVVNEGPHEVRIDLMGDRSDGMIFSSLGEVEARSLQGLLRGSYQFKGLTAQVYWTRADLELGLRFPGVIPDIFPGLGRIDGIGDTFDGEVLYEWDLGKHHVTGGAGGRLNRFRIDAQAGGGADETLSHALLQDIWAIQRDLTLTTGIRYDGNSITKPAVSPRAALTYTPGDHHAVRVSAGEAFRNPAFIENQIDLEDLRAVFPDGSIANPDLENEAIRSYELAYSYSEEHRLRLQANAFYNQIRDFSSFDLTSPGSPTFARYRSLADGFDAWGGELSAEGALGRHLEIFGHAAYVRISENPRDPLVAEEAPRWRGLVGLRYRRSPLRGQLTLIYVGSRTIDVQEPAIGILGGFGGQQPFVAETLQSYVTLNAHVAVAILHDRMELFLTAFNALGGDAQDFPSRPWDRDHDPSTPPENFGGEPAPRQFLAGLTFRF